MKKKTIRARITKKKNTCLVRLPTKMKPEKQVDPPNQIRKVLLGEVGVDSGQLMVCDPCYIGREWQTPEENNADFAHTIYRDTETGKYWQFCYGSNPTAEGVVSFLGSYECAIPEIGETPNNLIRSKRWVEDEGKDPTPHIPMGEFSFRGIGKVTDNPNQGGPLNFSLGHPGVAVAFRSGLGDGLYKVEACLKEIPGWGERIVSVHITLIEEEEV